MSEGWLFGATIVCIALIGLAAYFMYRYFVLCAEIGRFHEIDCPYNTLLVANCCENNDRALMMLHYYNWDRPQMVKDIAVSEVVAEVDGHFVIHIDKELWFSIQESVAAERNRESV